jgi:hypothetical protein
MRIVSWNMDHWRRRRPNQKKASWAFLSGLEPDFALLQETAPPAELPAANCVYRARGMDGKAGWGSAETGSRPGGGPERLHAMARPHRARHRNALERFATLGLVDCLALERPSRRPLAKCPCEDDPCRHVQTHRHPPSPHPWQNDYVFVNQSLASRVVSCIALNGGGPDPWQFSDHCPVILELRL